ncbi:GroES-like protein [Stipitochalara longipes BDJ]|nr:GroES-like protein [Stipitochalara longipes BDJ]
MSSTSQITYRGVENVVKSITSTLPALERLDVLIKITHSSLCGTDLAYIAYGIALGHEGVGIIQEVGSAVTQLKIGDRVGGGYHRGSCGHCKYCLNGQDIWCYERVIFGEGDYDNGTFSPYYIGRETYVHKIPEGIPSEFAAPLQCAGATVYGAMAGTVKPSQRVGIIGIGGLGHLAIQFASKLGASVVVFSHSANKEAEARSFGAEEFYPLDDISKMATPVDVLILTANRYPDWNKFLIKSVLARTGTVIPLSEPSGPMELPSLQMFFEGYNVRTNLVASRGVHGDMLEFAARHKIRPMIETFPLSEEGLGRAVEKLKAGSVRYRAVLVAEDGR